MVDGAFRQVSRLLELILTLYVLRRFCPCHGSHYDICKIVLQSDLTRFTDISGSRTCPKGSCSCRYSLFS